MSKTSRSESVDYDKNDELIGNINPNQRNWRGIGIALLVILAVCAIIITAVILVTPDDNKEKLGNKIQLDNLFQPDYAPKIFESKWLPDREEFLFKDHRSHIVRYNAVKHINFSILDNRTFLELDATWYSPSADLRYVAVRYDERRIFRHSILGRYLVVKLLGKSKRYLSLGKATHLQYISWGPRASSIVYVKNNNIYYRPKFEGAEVAVTTDGDSENILNGAADWIYEEEILGTDQALWWSPRGSHICYASFNETNVPKYLFSRYGSPSDYYTHVTKLSYPKVGYPIPTFKLIVYNFLERTKVELQPPAEIISKEHYFTAVTWRDENHVVVTWSLRAQNFSVITNCNISDGQCQDILKVKSHGGWVFLIKPPWFIENGTQFLMVLSDRQDIPNGYFQHLTMKSVLDGSQVFLTSGLHDVDAIVGVNENRKLVFYLSNGGNPLRRHLYSVSYDRNSRDFSRSRCLSCGLFDDCQFVTADFSRTSEHYILGCKGPGVPFYILKRVGSTSKQYKMLENNSILSSKLKTLAVPKKQFFNVTVDGEAIYGYYYEPRDLVKEQTITYPVLITIYGGPNSHAVTEEFKLDWMTYMSSNRNFICGSIDGRGTKGRGDKFLHALYKKLGTVEVRDQLETSSKFFDNLSFSANSKKSIWGWSYGGFLSLHALADPSKVFKCAISVSPVTDWRYYDAVYSERFMGLPTASDNFEGYQAANVSGKLKGIGDNSLLLVHGTSDDNVHFQHTAQLMDLLVKNGIMFQPQIYIDEKHGLHAVRKHLYQTMENFLEDCLGLQSDSNQRRKTFGSNKQESLKDQ